MIVTAQEKRKKLKELLRRPGCTPVPGVFDALGARIVEKTGFDAAFIGSYALAASAFGLPDVGEITLTETVNYYKNVANSVNIPVIADGENGFFHAANIWRTVREMEDAGIAGIHIEDHELGKHMKFPPGIYDEEKMCKKIRAAVDARTDENFIIIARTDAAWITKDMDVAVHRANAYLEAGADAAYIIGADMMPDAFPNDLYKRVNGPLVGVCCPGTTVRQESEAGLKLSLYWSFLLGASFHAMREVLERFKATGDYIASAGEYRFDEAEINKYIRVDEFVDRAEKYLL